MIFKRLMFVEFVKAMTSASTAADAEEARTKIIPQTGTVGGFVTSFTDGNTTGPVHQEDEQAADDDVEADSAQKGLHNATAKKFGEFRETLSHPGRLLADIMAKTQSLAFDEEFLLIANAEAMNSSFVFPWADLYKGTVPDEKIAGLSLPSMHGACIKWIASTLAQPTAANSQASAIGDMDRTVTMATQQCGEEEEHMRKKTIARLEELVRQNMSIEVIGHDGYQALALTKAYRALREIEKPRSAVGDNKKNVEQQNRRLFLACAELFPGHSSTHSNDIFRGVITGCTAEFNELVKWMVTAKQQTDVVVIADGRSEVARKQIRNLLTSIVSDDFVELWVIYDMETKLHTDVRNPKRKLAWSSSNMEVMFALLPRVTKGQRAVIARDQFTKCGESTNFSRSYSGVPFRNLIEIPRLTSEAKSNILGGAAVGAFEKDRVNKEVESKGHPLFWGEWKPIALFGTLIRDFRITDVVDMTPATGAASIAAMHNSIPYHALCHNQAHKQWFEALISRVFAAMVLKKDVASDQEFVKLVGVYLQRAAEAAKHMLPNVAASAVGDSFTGENDSDDEQ